MTDRGEMPGPRHVDDFIDDPSSDPYAASWFESFRRPAVEKCRTPDSRKLFATYQGKRYRVTGCSRLGDVWLSANHDRDMGYELRVDVDSCSAWDWRASELPGEERKGDGS